MVETEQRKPLRFSTPPYCVATVDGAMPMLNLPGESWKHLERSVAPSVADVRALLLRLRSDLRWPRATLAAFLGVSLDVVRRWETGERNPTGAARRLIWLLHLLATQPEKLASGLDLIVWGRGDELAAISEAFKD